MSVVTPFSVPTTEEGGLKTHTSLTFLTDILSGLEISSNDFLSKTPLLWEEAAFFTGIWDLLLSPAAYSCDQAWTYCIPGPMLTLHYSAHPIKDHLLIPEDFWKSRFHNIETTISLL